MSIDWSLNGLELTDRLERSLAEHFRSNPVRIMWAMRDVASTPQMLDDLWPRTFPTAEVTRLQDAGHFLQEDAHERIVPELLCFLAQPPDRTAVDHSTIYLHADMATKERALARTTPVGVTPGRYRPGDPLLAFLEGL